MKYARANFLTPVPEAASYAELNTSLATRCRARQGEHAGRHATTIGERLVADTAVLRSLPAVALWNDAFLTKLLAAFGTAQMR